MNKHDLEEIVIRAVQENGGSVRSVDVAKYVWEHHEDDLRQSGDLFYTWQYDLRWAAQRLQNAGRLAPKHGSHSGTWDLP